eukprot:381483-Prorocentrum_minimum.AAC.1
MQCGKPLESFLRYRKTKNKGPGALQAQWGATSAERTAGSAGGGLNKRERERSCFCDCRTPCGNR